MVWKTSYKVFMSEIYPMSSSGEERESDFKIEFVSIVWGPLPSWALITDVNAWAAIP